jgi:hypothetical protein
MPAERVARIERASPQKQLVLASTLVNHPPTLRLYSARGTPLAGVEVKFVVSGSRDTTLVRSDARGIASLQSWMAASQPATIHVDAHVDTFPPMRFLADVQQRGFDVDVRLLGGDPGPDGLAAIRAAEAKIESLIFADLPNEVLADQPVCRIAGAAPIATLNEEVDDVLIFVRLRAIDGPGTIGATGNPCLIRDTQGQTLVGFIELDLDDWAFLLPALKRDFMLHEMIHVLGFVPNLLNLTTPTGYSRTCLQLPSRGAPNVLVQDSHFSCEFARAAFEESQGGSYLGAHVPLENGATRPLGSGTLNHHWRKNIFGAELMTGWFSSGGVAPLSRVTLGMLEDLGYGVVSAAADDWSVINPGPLQSVSGAGNQVLIKEPATRDAPVVFRRPRSQ